MTAAPAPGPRRPVELPAVVDTSERRWPDLHGRAVLTLLLGGMFVWSLLQVEWSRGLFRANGLGVLERLVTGLLTPDLSAATLGRATSAAWTTTVYAVGGMTLALALAVPLGVLAAGVTASDGGTRRTMMVATRTLLAWLRSIHELVWAWLFVAAIGLSPFAAIFALALPYAGILGRIYADLLNDVSPGPLRALRAAGAGETEVFLYGRLPIALPDMVAYSFYRFECALRSAAIMGFIGLGGLGYEVQLALADLHYSTVSTYLIAMILLIVLVETWSSLVRREMTS